MELVTGEKTEALTHTWEGTMIKADIGKKHLLIDTKAMPRDSGAYSGTQPGTHEVSKVGLNSKGKSQKGPDNSKTTGSMT